MPKPSSIPLPPASTTPTNGAGEMTPPLPKPVRRTFSAADKLRIVREADACTERGQIEALLRREGIYSSLLAVWRKALKIHGERGMAARKPGRPPQSDERNTTIERLQRDNARLQAELTRSQAVIELQKKVSEILSLVLPPSDES
jgi:transposase